MRIAGLPSQIIHEYSHIRTAWTGDTGEPDDAKVSRPVRRGADGNVHMLHMQRASGLPYTIRRITR